jgi:glycosyltransferase involved in cell wall biosynthesis
VLAVGRLHKQKDYPTLIRAFARVRATRDARLMILGEAKEPEKDRVQRTALMALAAELRVERDVRLPGFVENPFSYMARAGVLVLSSAWEGLPAVLVQALACGCPVVSTDCPSGPAEILDRGSYGRLVSIGDDEGLAAAIEQTLSTPHDVDRLRRRASMFSVDGAVSRYSELLGLNAA